MTRKYRLLKDLPGAQPGDLFQFVQSMLTLDGSLDWYGKVTLDGHTRRLTAGYPKITALFVESSPDWFEEVKEGILGSCAICNEEEEPAQGFQKIVWDKRSWGASAAELIKAQKKANAEASEKIDKVIPESEAWVTPGQKYRHVQSTAKSYFIPETFSFFEMAWSGVDHQGVRQYHRMNKQLWLTLRDEKPKRFAPALRKALTGIRAPIPTQTLYASEEEARADYKDDFIMWPALPDKDGWYPGPEGNR